MSTLLASEGSRRLLAALFVFALTAFGLTYEHLVPGQLVRLAVAGTIAAAFGLFVVAYPKWGLYFGVFYVFAGLAFYFSGVVPLAVMTLVFGATVLRYFRSDTFQLVNAEYNWSLAVFSLICITSIMWAHDPRLSLLSLSQLLKVALTVFLIVQLIRTPRDLELLLATIVFGALASSVFGVVNLYLGLDRETTSVGPTIAGVMRFAGTYDNSNAAALYWLMPIPFAVFLLKRARWWALRAVLLLAVVGLVTSVVLSFSRGALPPLLLVLVAILFREARRRRTYVLFGIALAVGIVLTPPIYWLRLMSLNDLLSGALQDWSFFLRYLALKAGVTLFLENPLTGVGLYNFLARCGNELFVPLQTHNTYLEIAVGVGIFGLIAYMSIHLSGFLALVRVWRHKWDAQTKWMRDLAFYTGLSHITVLCSALFQSIEFYQMVWMPIAVALVASNLIRYLAARPLPENS